MSSLPAMTAATRFPDSLIQGFPGAGHISGGKQFLAKGFFDHPVKRDSSAPVKSLYAGLRTIQSSKLQMEQTGTSPLSGQDLGVIGDGDPAGTAGEHDLLKAQHGALSDPGNLFQFVIQA